MKAKLFATLLLLTPFTATAVENWECTEYRQTSKSEEKNVLMTATADPDSKTGTISVAGVKHETSYSAEGFERQWSFSDESNETIYQLDVKPNGWSAYYELNILRLQLNFIKSLEGEVEGVEPSLTFWCKEV